MKSLITILFLLMLGAPVFSQSLYYGFSEKDHQNITEICQVIDGMGFSPPEANDLFNKILKATSQNSNGIIVQPCSNLNRVAFSIIRDGKKYLLYNPSKVTDVTSDRYWANCLIFAHELGHHFLNHMFQMSTATAEQKRNFELAADEFAGQVIAKMDGDLTQALTVFDYVTSPTAGEEIYSDYPTKQKRIEAVTRGFNSQVAVVPHTVNNNYIQKLFEESDLKIEKMDESLVYDNVNKEYENGLFSNRLVYSNNSYYTILSKKHDGYNVVWNYADFPADAIKEAWDKGFRIQSIDCSNGYWSFTSMKNDYKEGYKFFSGTLGGSDFKTFIADLANNGYAIQDLTYDSKNNRYLALYDKDNTTNGGWGWAVRTSYDEIRTYFKAQWDLNYKIYSIKNINGAWFCFTVKSTASLAQHISIRDKSNLAGENSKWQELLNQGYELVYSDLGGENVVLLFEKP